MTCTANALRQGFLALSIKKVVEVEKEVDGDKARDGVDNCPRIANPSQDDNDKDGIGNACESGGFCFPIVVDDEMKAMLCL